MGGRVASMIADELFEADRIAGLLCVGYPFHPIGKPEKLRTEHLKSLQTPTLICQGTRDLFGSKDEVGDYDLSPAIQLSWFEDGDHDLKPRKRISGFTHEDHINAMGVAVSTWIDGVFFFLGGGFFFFFFKKKKKKKKFFFFFFCWRNARVSIQRTRVCRVCRVWLGHLPLLAARLFNIRALVRNLRTVHQSGLPISGTTAFGIPSFWPFCYRPRIKYACPSKLAVDEVSGLVHHMVVLTMRCARRS